MYTSVPGPGIFILFGGGADLAVMQTGVALPLCGTFLDIAGVQTGIASLPHDSPGTQQVLE